MQNELMGASDMVERGGSAAEESADDSKLRLEKQKERTLRLKEKIRRRKERGKVLKSLLTPKAIFGVSIGLVIVLVLCFVVFNPLGTSEEETKYLSSAELEKIVNVSKLSTAEYVYNGIAEIANDEGEITQRIKYDATVRAGIDMEEVSFDIDNDAMTVTPVLPDITIDDPELDVSSFDYMPSDPDMELPAIISVASQDALSEVESSGGIYQTAEANLRSAIKALTLPIISKYGYELTWDDEGKGKGVDGAKESEMGSGNIAEKEGADE